MKKPLFIPLAGEHYDRFESGEKRFEFRRDKAPWNAKNCIVGREVILSRGYGKKNRSRGVIRSFESVKQDRLSPRDLATFRTIYPDWRENVAVIGIDVLGAV